MTNYLLTDEPEKADGMLMGKRKRIPVLSLSRTRPPPPPAHPAGPAHPSADARAQAHTHNPAYAPASTPTPNPSAMKPELLQAAVAKLNEQNYLSQSQSQSQGDTQQEFSSADATAYASTSAALVTVTGFSPTTAHTVDPIAAANPGRVVAADNSAPAPLPSTFVNLPHAQGSKDAIGDAFEGF